MEIKIKKTFDKKLKKDFQIILPKEIISKKIEDYIEKVKGNVSLNGFRKGQVPPAVIKEKYGKSIMGDEIDKLIDRLKSMKYNFTYEQSVIEKIAKVGFDELFGARPIKRAIQDKIEDLISEKILTNEVVEDKQYILFVKVEGDEQIIELEERVVSEPKKKGRKKKED